MKRILIACSAMVCLFSFSVAFAQEDAANMFKTHCQSCHGPDAGREPAPGINPIKGQDSAVLLKALHGYKDGAYGGERKQVMQGVVKKLSDDQMKGLADYISKM